MTAKIFLDLRGILGSMGDARQCGVAFEAVLNDIFKLDGLSVRESFTLNTEIGQIGE